VDIDVSFPLAFTAGLVSFLSPCVLPVVPSYVAFVSGLTLDELRDGSVPGARAAATLHATLFVAGFSLVFMTMGLVATSAGAWVAGALPWISRLGGVAVVLFGLHLLGWLRVPALARELRTGSPRVERDSSWRGLAAVAAGIAFGAGWTPCIGPVLGSILLYTSLEPTAAHGTALLGTYAVGLGIPFIASATALNWFLAGAGHVRRYVVPLQRMAGGVLVLIGILMTTGRFATLSAALAGMGQLINLDVQ
jgi:cytochrome c-type biogenesis protein